MLRAQKRLGSQVLPAPFIRQMCLAVILYTAVHSLPQQSIKMEFSLRSWDIHFQIVYVI